MKIRQKYDGIRITFCDTSKPQQINYISIKPDNCWCSTFNDWGKPTDSPIVRIGEKLFKISLEEVT